MGAAVGTGLETSPPASPIPSPRWEAGFDQAASSDWWDVIAQALADHAGPIRLAVLGICLAVVALPVLLHRRRRRAAGAASRCRWCRDRARRDAR